MISNLSNLYINQKGRPLLIEYTHGGVAKSVILEEGAIFDSNFYKADVGSMRVDGKSFNIDKNLIKPLDILKTAAYLDFETQGKVGGSVITEAAVYKPGESALDVYFIKPYVTSVVESRDEELANMSSRVQRQIKLHKAVQEYAPGMFVKTLIDAKRRSDHTGADDTLISKIRKLASTDKDAQEVMRILNLETKHLKKFEGKAERYFEMESKLLRMDQKYQALTGVGNQLREAILTTMGIEDPFQARNYVASIEEAKRVGLKRTFFQGSELSELIFKQTEYLRDFSALNIEEQPERIREFLRIAGGKGVDDLAITARQIDVSDFVFRELPKVAENYNIQAANALFESARTGEVVRAFLDRHIDPSITDIAERNKAIQMMFTEAVKGKHKDRYGTDFYNPFIGKVKGVSPTGNPFYPTGQEYNIARASGFKTNQFQDLLLPYLMNTGKGDVRDIQDVMRITQSYGKQLGLIDIAKPQALSVEIQARLFGAAQALEAGGGVADVISELLEKETHLSYGDVFISSPKITEQGLEMSIAAREFQMATELGDEYYKMAQKGRGGLFKLAAYNRMLDYFRTSLGADLPGLEDVLFRQRVHRDISSVLESEVGQLRVVEGQRYRIQDQLFTDKQGRVIKKPVTTNLAQFNFYKGIEGVLDASKKYVSQYSSVDYDTVIRDIFSSFKDTKEAPLFDFSKETGLPQIPKTLDENLDVKRLEQIIAINRGRTESNYAQIKVFEDRLRSREGLEKVIRDIKDSIPLIKDKRIKVSDALGYGVKTEESLIKMHPIRSIAKKLVAPYVGVASALGGLSLLKDTHYKERSDYLIPNYNQWFRNQSEMFGSESAFIEAMQEKHGYFGGMQEGGIAADLRKAFTDFGSPYTGPEYSNSVLDNMDILNERQKLLRSRYAQRHLSYEGDVYNLLRSFVSNTFTPPELTLEHRVKPLLSSNVPATDYTNLKGKNLVKVNLTNGYKINVDDADTITVKRTGVNSGPMAKFFGFGSGEPASIRLAGIDSPEIEHAGRGAQPYAHAAKRIAMDMINRAKNVEVVFDPSDATYGRRVGMVYADGVNVNLELIKRGAAAYLPYRHKGKQQMYNGKAFQDAQENAIKSRRGMWRSDYFKAYAEISKSTGETITFNTLADPGKLAKNTSLMSIGSAMKNAEAFGLNNTAAQMEIAEVAETVGRRKGKLGNRLFKPDYNYNEWREDFLFMPSKNSILTPLDQIKQDLKGSISTHGSSKADKFSNRRYRNLDVDLSNQLTTPSSNSFNKHVFNTQRRFIKEKRLLNMAMAQQYQNKRMFVNHQQHHRM